MIFVNKRGISPLIASVLLIAFVIALFVLVSSFITKTSEEAMEGTEGKVASAVKCTTTNIEIGYAWVDNKNSPTSLKLDVDSGSDSFITGLKVRVVGETSADVMNYPDDGNVNVAPYDRIVSRGTVTRGSPFKLSGTGKWIRVEVIPEIESGYCSGSMETVEAGSVQAPQAPPP